MDQALSAFAAELDDPSADLVIAALMLSATRRGDRLGEVLTGLTTAAREELEMRRKISAGRVELRRGVQIVVAVTIAIGVFLVVFSGTYIAPYGTPAGQVALAVVVGIFAAGVPVDAETVRAATGRPVPGPARAATRPRTRPGCCTRCRGGPVIAAVGLGALCGGVVFLLVLHLVAAAPGAAGRAGPVRRRPHPWKCRGAGDLGRARVVADDRGPAGRGRGVGGPAADPPRGHEHEPAAGPGVDRPNATSR